MSQELADRDACAGIESYPMYESPAAKFSNASKPYVSWQPHARDQFRTSQSARNRRATWWPFGSVKFNSCKFDLVAHIPTSVPDSA
eukprot:3867084-Rhodomonas_salina.4